MDINSPHFSLEGSSGYTTQPCSFKLANYIQSSKYLIKYYYYYFLLLTTPGPRGFPAGPEDHRHHLATGSPEHHLDVSK